MPQRGAPPGGLQVTVGGSGVQHTASARLVSQTCLAAQHAPSQQTSGAGQSGPGWLSATGV